MSMGDDWTEEDETELTAEEREDRSRAVARAEAFVWAAFWYPRKGAVWDPLRQRKREWAMLH